MVVVVIQSPPAANTSGTAHPIWYYERLDGFAGVAMFVSSKIGGGGDDGFTTDDISLASGRGASPG